MSNETLAAARMESGGVSSWLAKVGWGLVIVLSGLAVLRATSVVTVPLALALFIVILAWPLQLWLEGRGVARGLAYGLTMLGVVAVMLCFVAILYVCINNVVTGASEFDGRLVELQDRGSRWVDDMGLAMEDLNGGEQLTVQRILGWLAPAFKWGYGFLGQLVLVITFAVLGLVEVHRSSCKVGEGLRPEAARKVREVGREVGTTLQRYMLVRTGVSATTGLLVWAYTAAIGLEFPLVWGVSSFLLNYVPMLGSIVAVVPPTLFALLHPEWWVFFAALGGLTTIQFVIGNFIDPRLEGRVLSLSPFVLFLSIVLWGWLWGIPGALLGIPLTAIVVIVCRRFDATQGFARLLMR